MTREQTPGKNLRISHIHVLLKNLGQHVPLKINLGLAKVLRKIFFSGQDGLFHMEEFRTTLIYFPSMTPSRSRWQQCAAKRQVMQHKPKRYSIAAALFCPGLSLCVEWSRPNKQLHELQCCGSRLCMFSTLPFLTIVAIFLFCSTHVFFFIR